MNDDTAVAAPSTLAHADRLAASRPLVCAGADGMSSGEIAQAPAVPPTHRSVHLSALERAGLLRSWRDGRHVLYAAHHERMRRLLAFLTEDCCTGMPEICGPFGDPAPRTYPPEPARNRHGLP
ncbi:transcriptional regulator [Aureimonas flava]|uniref:Transcriptional regulator n=1 Tax=Aureimonas flava TaxID=2320271 RepID=A0A3A1WJ74_9HYPH|nr:helix-turn-helix transcriptional regulator [Aureimonas flava]RIX99702.1 transcriptional regulator [Aureimonas flava]